MQKKRTVSVVIPAWNSEKQLIENLPSVFAASYQVGAEIIIVDDASTDDRTASYLKSLGGKIRLYENKKNEGFAATVNRGVSLASADVIMLINTDVRPTQDCFVHALTYFADESIYALGFNSGEGWMGGEWERGLFHHFGVMPEPGTKNISQPSLWASGGQAAFSRKKWLTLGGMDVLYTPFYWEDTDMGYRAWKRGWQILWAPECMVVHDHKKSVIATNFGKDRVTDIARRNQFLFVWKNIGDLGFLLEHILKLPFYLLKYPGPVCQAFLKLPQALARRYHEARYWKRSDRDILSLWAK